MSKLFDFKDVKANPSRSGFDLTQQLVYTSKLGHILPLRAIWTMPGDKFDFKCDHFTRTAPVQSAAYTRIREYFDWFFVPLRLLWKTFPSTITNMENNPVQAQSFSGSVPVTTDLPYVQSSDLGNLVCTCLNGTTLYHGDDYFGFSRAMNWQRLSSYLGYQHWPASKSTRGDDGHIDSWPSATLYNSPVVPMNLFALAAYHKVYNDYFRDSQWEHASPFLWNFDYSSGGKLTLPLPTDPYWNGFTMFDIHYANYPKDLFMGLLPNSQYGEVAQLTLPVQGGDNGIVQGTVKITTPNPELKVSVESSAIYPLGGENLVLDGSNPYQLSPADAATDLQGVRIVTGSPSGTVTSGQSLSGNTATDLQGLYSTLSVLALRQAEYLQRWKEIAQSGSQDYRDQIYRNFGVTLPQELSDLCTYIFGSASNLTVNEVVNQTFTDEVGEGGLPTSSPFIKGKGLGSSRFGGSFYAKEHGIILCVYHATPLLTYDISGYDLFNVKTSFYDFAIPMFDRIGYQQLPVYALSTESEMSGLYKDDFLGYSPRYVEYKTAYDRVLGDFAMTLKDWVAPVDDDYLKNAFIGNTDDPNPMTFNLNYNFFKVNPRLVDNVFGVESGDDYDTDQLRIQYNMDVKAVRNLDYNGLPY